MVQDKVPRISAIDKLPFYTEQHSSSELEAITIPVMTSQERKELDAYLLKENLEFNTTFADMTTQIGRYNGKKFYVQVRADALYVPSTDRTMFFAMTPLSAAERKNLETSIQTALDNLRSYKKDLRA